MAGVLENLNSFLGVQSDFDVAFSPATLAGQSVWRFDADHNLPMPIFVDTGENGLESPMERKMFRNIEVHGVGSFAMRVWVDGKIVVPVSHGTATEDPSKSRIVSIPRGTKGYTIRIQLCGSMLLRCFSIIFEPMITQGSQG